MLGLAGCLVTRSEIAAKGDGEPADTDFSAGGDADTEADTDTDDPDDTDGPTTDPTPSLACPTRYRAGNTVVTPGVLDVFSLVPADLDGDGLTDLAGTKEEVGWLRNAGGGAFEPGYFLPTAESVAGGPLEEDDPADELALVSDGVVAVASWSQALGLTPGVPIAFGARLVGVADVSGDGRSDLVVVSADGVSSFIGTSDGWFEVPSSGPGANLATAVTLDGADVGDDGDVDFAILTEGSVVFAEDIGGAFEVRTVEGPELLFRAMLAQADTTAGAELVGVEQTGALTVWSHDPGADGWTHLQDVPRISAGFPVAGEELDFGSGCSATLVADTGRVELWFAGDAGGLDPAPLTLALPALGGEGAVEVVTAAGVDADADGTPDVVAILVQGSANGVATWLLEPGP
ncbi:MAG: hypothetical protein H0V89_01050 [Deltaproteobacteria bacterium]|nr:hypothetical protein [Deltaproteobacteria bacterium]